MLDYMAAMGQTPNLILVAIDNSNERTRDLTPTHSIAYSRPGETNLGLSNSGGGEVFLDFVEHELIPHIEKQYEPMPYRILVGHSLGGLAALYSLISRPHLFQAHIAVDSIQRIGG